MHCLCVVCVFVVKRFRNLSLGCQQRNRNEKILNELNQFKYSPYYRSHIHLNCETARATNTAQKRPIFSLWNSTTKHFAETSKQRNYYRENSCLGECWETWFFLRCAWLLCSLSCLHNLSRSTKTHKTTVILYLFLCPRNVKWVNWQ